MRHTAFMNMNYDECVQSVSMQCTTFWYLQSQLKNDDYNGGGGCSDGIIHEFHIHKIHIISMKPFAFEFALRYAK